MSKVASRRSGNRRGESQDRVTEETHQQLPRSHIQNIQWKKDRGWASEHTHTCRQTERESTLKWRQLSPETEDGGMTEPPVAPKNDRILNPYFFPLPPAGESLVQVSSSSSKMNSITRSSLSFCILCLQQQPITTQRWAPGPTPCCPVSCQSQDSQSTSHNSDSASLQLNMTKHFLLKLIRQFHINLFVCSRSRVWRSISATFKPFIWGLPWIVKSDFKIRILTFSQKTWHQENLKKS